jgi:hypothetical protein
MYTISKLISSTIYSLLHLYFGYMQPTSLYIPVYCTEYTFETDCTILLSTVC